MIKALFKVFFYIPAIPIATLIRIISPVIIIRTGPLMSGRIGHFAMNTELDQCKKIFFINTPKKYFLDLYYIARPSCNKQLEIMWRRKLSIVPIELLGPIDQISRKYFYSPKFDAVYKTSVVDNYNLLDKTKPILEFTDQEISKGNLILKSMGIPIDAKYVCLIIRDSKYLEKLNPDIDWSYHDYRDTSIENYYLAAEELARLGYYVLRMGSEVKKAFNLNNKQIIDYANSIYRSDFMDVFLCAHCTFSISSGTGLESVPEIFRRPTLFVNYAPIGYVQTFSKNYLFTTKKIYDNFSKKYLSLSEIKKRGAHLFQRTEDYTDNNLSLIENSPDEILNATLEMLPIAAGIYKPLSPLQEKYWSAFPINAVDTDGQRLHGEIRANISLSFIRNNQFFIAD